ncbi:ATP-binding protein [Sphingobacterium sp. UT-1RO-CII-1]|uniref:ATP-binding protein n=1 Tax=Sphingobacterium sp. UT-1RO-CII-1 TaxID=2995225 RepID=UPI00227C411C|nr:ATP-binding protein [Sphingobacterium sp. UT-1RO-CII-1]MCY4778565.1 ATP-binding protein [Sphingobacterium sp. UT-1RO-CII-1]
MSELFHINNSYESYQKIISFYQQNKDLLFDDIHISIKSWFSANMSASLGAVLDLFIDNINSIHFDHIPPKTEDILLKNGFLTFYGKEGKADINHTTIKYQKLKPTDGKYFKAYVIDELIGRSELPSMSDPLKEKMVEAIYEIFVNAQIHSKSNVIYTCGQFFPAKNKIEFTIVDTGIGFKANVDKKFNVNLHACQAIKWAVQDRNTTKDITGGIGLAVLKEFVHKNNGYMQIVSGDGFYEFNKNGEKTASFTGKFPGTIVNLQFSTNDNSNYCLASEIDINNIF